MTSKSEPVLAVLSFIDRVASCAIQMVTLHAGLNVAHPDYFLEFKTEIPAPDLVSKVWYSLNG